MKLLDHRRTGRNVDVGDDMPLLYAMRPYNYIVIYRSPYPMSCLSKCKS